MFWRRYKTPLAALSFIAAGGAAALFASGSWDHRIWLAGLIITGIPLLLKTVRGMLGGRFALDLTASLTVVASLILGQPLVGLIIVLMQSGGEALERLAEGRASDALNALEDNAPRILHLLADGDIHDVQADDVGAGDLIVLRPGEMLGCDGDVVAGESHLDTSSITGEPVPQHVRVGSHVMSGSINQERPLTVRVTAIARESQYARIVELVREAKSSKAPLQRIADRYAALFTPLILIVCAAAYLASRDWMRVLAVLAVATPCPLLLATPVAVLGGLNRSARRQVLIRTGAALEGLGKTTAVLLDKTGTITIGHPEVTSVHAVNSISADEIVRLSSAVEQGSGHPLAQTLIAEARRRQSLALPAINVSESPGRGVEGDVEGRRVMVGARSLLAERYPGTRSLIESLDRSDQDDPTLRAYVAVDGNLVGIVEYADMIRPGMRALVERLRGSGVEHVVMLSGDRSENAERVARETGIDDWRGDMLPQDKVEVVKRFLHDGESVVMVGDGTNDAPALSTATVGVALASRGRGIATEAADVILLADDPSRLADAIDISRRTMRIARQSIWWGLGISAAGMMMAAWGLLAPIAGAAVQEVVDLAVILNALRAAAAPMYGKN
ncbi:MAG TPA: heavy metal translocating P-type ATPase [Gemmatimonadaceae bacterium]|jgi:heavy metal translocating P-type ATPase|nr:heavy metal translocating P-type ATPase [Gemmatimonadaceae bacterium]